MEVKKVSRDSPEGVARVKTRVKRRGYWGYSIPMPGVKYYAVVFNKASAPKDPVEAGASN